MTARKIPSGSVHVLRASVPTPPPAPYYDWPSSPQLELWALRVRLDAMCRKGESREGWVSCRLLRRAMG